MAIMAVLIANGGGIPNAGLVKVLVMIQAFGIPLEMGVTTLNCLEDIVGALIADKRYGGDSKEMEEMEAAAAILAEEEALAAER